MFAPGHLTWISARMEIDCPTTSTNESSRPSVEVTMALLNPPEWLASSTTPLEGTRASGYIPSTTRVFFIAQTKNIYPSSNNPIGPYISYPALRFCPKRLRYQLWLVRQNSAQPCGTGGVVVKLEELQQKWEGKGFLHEENLIEDIDISSMKLTVRTWKLMVVRLLSFWKPIIFRFHLLNFGGTNLHGSVFNFMTVGCL